MLHRKGDLVFRFAHARKSAPARVAARLHHPLQFATADDVEAAPQPRQQAQHGLVGVRLDREADQVFHPGHRLVELPEMLAQGPLRVHVKGRAEFPGERFKRNALAVKFAADITKVVHRREV